MVDFNSVKENQPEYANEELSNEIYVKRRIINQLEQMLGYSLNMGTDVDNISDIFRVFKHVLSDQSNQMFQDSLNNSYCLLKDKKTLKPYLEGLKRSDPNSFLIATFSQDAHRFCCVIRKTSEGYSATIVNASAGGRDSRRSYEEFVFTDKNISKLVEVINTKPGSVNIDTFYKLFQEASDYCYLLHVQSRDQKTGNCFIKEPEKAVKYAFATCDFSEEKFRELREEPDKKFAEMFKPKWKPSTERIHEIFTNELVKENPALKERLLKIFEAYSQNKHFRQNMKKGIPVIESLQKAFDPENKLNCVDIKKLFKNIDAISFSQYKEELLKVVEMVNEPAFTNSIKTLEDYNNILKEQGLEEQFPFMVRQLRQTYSLKCLDSIRNSESEEKKMMLLDDCVKLWPYSGVLFVIKGDFYESRGMTDIAIKDYTRAIEIAPKYASPYFKRGEIYAKEGNLIGAVNDLEKAILLDPQYSSAREQWIDLSLKLAHQQIDNKDLAGARQTLQRLLLEDKKNEQALELLKQVQFDNLKGNSLFNFLKLNNQKNTLKLSINI